MQLPIRNEVKAVFSDVFGMQDGDERVGVIKFDNDLNWELCIRKENGSYTLCMRTIMQRSSSVEVYVTRVSRGFMPGYQTTWFEMHYSAVHENGLINEVREFGENELRSNSDSGFFVVFITTVIHAPVPILNKSGIPTKDLYGFEEGFPLADVVIVYGGKKYHVNRNLLMSRSEYFRRLHDFEKTQKKEFVISSVLSNDKCFLSFLRVLHDQIDINDDNVDDILLLEEYFYAPRVRASCHKYLLESKSLSDADKFYMALKHNFQDLEAELIEKLTNEKDVFQMLSRCKEEHQELSRRTNIAIVQKLNVAKHARYAPPCFILN